MSKFLLLGLSVPAVLGFAPSAPALRGPNHAVSRRAMNLQMSCPLTPLGTNVIVTMESENMEEKKSSSGILIAATVKSEGPKTGTVEAVGTGYITESGSKIPIEDVAVGDKVMFREPSALEGRKMVMDNKDFFVINVGDILAKID